MKYTIVKSSSNLTRAQKKQKSLRKVYSDWLSSLKIEWKCQISLIVTRLIFLICLWTMKRHCLRSTRLCSRIEQQEILWFPYSLKVWMTNWWLGMDRDLNKEAKAKLEAHQIFKASRNLDIASTRVTTDLLCLALEATKWATKWA